MTFYWWSHWFWITLLGNILLPIVFVHTYPSQDNIALEYNNNSGNKNERNIKSVTKLYQTTTTLIWATTLPPNHKETNLLAGAPIKLQNVPIIRNQTEVEESSEDDAEWNEGHETDDHSGSEDFEFKRSAVDSQANSTQIDDSGEALASNKQQNENKQSSSHIQEGTGEVQQHSIATLASKEHSNNATRQEKKLNDLSVNNNFTNFSASVTSSKNATSKQTPTVTTAKSSKPIGTSSSSSSSASASASTPSKPQIENNDGGGGTHSTVEWLAQVPPLQDLTVDESQDVIGQKVPFTLENVNKEEEIIRAENEHRSRKSKVLSAEYKHINRFINYSADSKSLLTRSAATAPVDYDSEGNISSEALAIRRTNMLDASTISAICFTIFGVCCTMGTIGLVLYRRRFLNKPQALSEPDSSVYIDDSTMRDNSDEMYSLDNDSFLNSLEAMTIQNYWTDTVKHTKL